MTNNIPPILRRGNQGTDVERLQRELSQLGYKVGVKGEFDQVTENAVKVF